MRDKSNRRIFFLLISCVCAILFLQAFWIRNFYTQVKQQFQAGVYASLERAVTELQKKEQLLTLREKQVEVMIAPGNSATLHKRQYLDTVIVSGHDRTSATRIRRVKRTSRGSDRETFFFRNQSSARAQAVVIGESSGPGSFSYHSVQSFSDSLKERDIQKLLNDFVKEANMVSNAEKDPDTIRAVITRALAARGITAEFEFSLRELSPKHHEVQAESVGYDSTAFSYKADLSANRFYRSDRYLFVQFPQQGSVLLSSMKGSLLLSLLFVGLLLGVFYFTSREIMRQKQLSDIRTDFVNNMTHELKTPIATIGLAVDAMRNPAIRDNNEKYAEYTSILKEENKKLNSHVERVLQLALLERKEMRLEMSPADLNALTEQVSAGFSLQAEAKDITILCDLPPQPVVISADADHMRSVIANLIDNAIKYSGKFSRIVVTLSRRNGFVQLSVSDQGKGIPGNEHEKIFEKFYRVSQQSLHDVKGFGLGLSYVKWVVEAHGGTVSVHSEVGKGSIFTIKLPLNEKGAAG